MFGKKRAPVPYLVLDPYVTFIESAGGSVVSKNILTGAGTLKWALREESTNPIDNGWRFLSDIDDQKWVDNADNHDIADFNTVANIEPAVLAIYNFPVGADLTFVDNGRRFFIDNETGAEVA